MCIAAFPGGAGCIGANTLQAPKSTFECPECIGTKKTSTTVTPYFLSGSCLERKPKIAWPLLMFTIQLKNLDSLVVKLISLTMESNFYLDKENVSFSFLPH